jgi:hypothetical protein
MIHDRCWALAKQKRRTREKSLNETVQNRAARLWCQYANQKRQVQRRAKRQEQWLGSQLSGQFLAGNSFIPNNLPSNSSSSIQWFTDWFIRVPKQINPCNLSWYLDIHDGAGHSHSLFLWQHNVQRLFESQRYFQESTNRVHFNDEVSSANWASSGEETTH